MNEYEEQIRDIVRLKRYEAPRDGYFEDFLEEFQSRQRQDLLKRSSLSLLGERVGTWFREMGSLKWVLGAGTAYAALMLGVAMWPMGPSSAANPHIQPASYERNASEPLPAVDFESGRHFRSREESKREF